MFAGVASDDLMDVVGQLHGVSTAAMAQILAGVLELDQRDAWRVDGATSMEMWLELRHGLARRTAREWVRTARALVFAPSLAEAFADGLLSWDQLLPAIDRVAFGGEDEREVAADSLGRSAAELERLAAEARRVSRQESIERHGRRYLRIRWDRDGMLRIHGRLPDAMGTAFEQAIRRVADSLPPDPNGEVRLPLEERQADALHALASSSIAADADPDRASVVLHVDAGTAGLPDDALGLASLQLGPLVSLATAQRLMCDSRCQVVVEDQLGQIVDVAKTTYTVPRWLRRRILDRDGGCRWPGCDRTAFLHIHHITYWTHGGLTEEPNLLALCTFHHRFVHEGGWQIEGDPLGRIRFVSRQGRVIDVGPPPLRPATRDALPLWSTDPPHRAA